VLPPSGVSALVVLAQEVVDARELAVAVEAHALVGQGQVHNAAGFEHALEPDQGREGILQVLEQMVRDHEVD
jgi:hypothetical protein